MSGSNRIAFNILQNQFTTYFMTAIRWQKIAYLKKRIKLGKLEFLAPGYPSMRDFAGNTRIATV